MHCTFCPASLLSGHNISLPFTISSKLLTTLKVLSPLSQAWIASFKLDEIKENFAYLFVGHWMQGHMGEDRKNVGLLIKSFFETFKNKKNPPALILKTCIVFHLI